MFKFNLRRDGWMRRSSCLRDGPKLAPYNPRKPCNKKGELRVVGKTLRLVSTKPAVPRNGTEIVYKLLERTLKVNKRNHSLISQ